jgi:hypothetical protein
MELNSSNKINLMKTAFVFLLSFSVITVFAQDKTAEKFAATITPADLKSKLSVIASAQMEGRETATEGQRRAAAYIENYFKKLKLLPGDSGKYQMAFPVWQDSITSATFNANNKNFSFGDDVVPGGNSIPSGSWQIPNIVFAGNGVKDSTRNDFDSLDVKNNWVLLTLSGNESFRDIFQKINFLSKDSAAGLLIVSNNFPRKNFTGKGNMYNTAPGSSNNFPVFFISQNAADAILNTQVDSTTVHKTYTTNLSININKTTNNLQSTDVIGVLPGTDKKDEYVFVTGHYDHLGKRDSVIYYGADDDGSGTTSVLEIAQTFAAARDKGFRPRRTMVFMTVSGEEKGLWGSKYYTDHPVFPLDSTSVDLNIDMVGRIDPSRNYGDSTNYVYTIGEDKLSSDLMRLSDSVNNTYTHLELDRKFNDPNDPNRFYYRSDHYNFASKGVPIIFYFNGVHADYHRPTDTIDKINFDVMAKRVKLVFYTAWAMANRDAMLKRDIPLNQQ